MTGIYVQITDTRGSTPRDAGTTMQVTETATSGTIGGGALEHQAISHARKMLQENGPDATRNIPLGPDLGQCCGGAVRLRFSRTPSKVDAPLLQAPLPVAPANAPQIPLWVWGAGHVGRAVVKQAIATRAFAVNWVDSSADRFPQHADEIAKILPTADMPLLASHAPKDAHHLIMTYSHDIDLALCAALLQRGFASCGLIGSATKWTRFGKRLRALNLDPAPITCPIGDPSLGKHPDQIASGTLRALLAYHCQKETA